MNEIPWMQVFQAGGILTIMATLIGAVLQHRATMTQSTRTAEVQLAVRESEEELGYVEKLQARVTQLETEATRLNALILESSVRTAHAEDRLMQVVRYAASLENRLHVDRDLIIADLIAGTPVPVTAVVVGGAGLSATAGLVTGGAVPIPSSMPMH